MERIVIAGASLAAVHAIDALRELGFGEDIVMVGAEPCLPYDRPPLSKENLTEPHLGPSLLRDRDWYERAGVSLELGRRACSLDQSRCTVTLSDGRALKYDGLVIATGSEPRTLPSGNEHVLFLRTMDDVVVLQQRLESATDVAIIGGGLLGLEIAATIAELGAQASVFESAPVPLGREFGDEVGEWFEQFHRTRGVTIMTGWTVVDVIEEATKFRLVFSDGDTAVADVVVCAAGTAPSVDWLQGSGLRVADGVLCDQTLRTNAQNIVAAGDVARWYHPLFDETMRIDHWKNAVEQGRHAARTLLGGNETYSSVPYFWSDQFGANIRFVGRAHAADEVLIKTQTQDALLVLYGRQGTHVGALCVNMTGELPALRSSIASGAPMWAAAS